MKDTKMLRLTEDQSDVDILFMRSIGLSVLDYFSNTKNKSLTHNKFIGISSKTFEVIHEEFNLREISENGK